MTYTIRKDKQLINWEENEENNKRLITCIFYVISAKNCSFLYARCHHRCWISREEQTSVLCRYRDSYDHS